MTRETTPDKARRYLTEGRLLLDRVDGDLVTARARGDGAVHRLGHDPHRGWLCDCPARGLCAHLLAVRLVTAVRGNSPDPGGGSKL